MKLDLTAIEKQARAVEAKGEGVHRRTLKGLDIAELEDENAEKDAKEGVVEKALSTEE